MGQLFEIYKDGKQLIDSEYIYINQLSIIYGGGMKGKEDPPYFLTFTRNTSYSTEAYIAGPLTPNFFEINSNSIDDNSLGFELYVDHPKCFVTSSDKILTVHFFPDGSPSSNSLLSAITGNSTSELVRVYCRRTYA